MTNGMIGQAGAGAQEATTLEPSQQQQPSVRSEPDGGGGEPPRTSDLTPAQYKAIEALLAGEPHRRVAEISGVDVTTEWRWRQQPCFVAELKRWQQALREDLLLKLESLGWDACETLRVALNSDSAAAQVAAAKLILHALGLDKPEGRD